MACEKCQGIGPGELVRLGKIEILRVTREPLNAMLGLDNGAAECRREGFPDLTPEQFVAMFCEHMKCEPEVEITRIVFRKLGT